MNVSRQPYGKIVWLKWPADHFPQVVKMVRMVPTPNGNLGGDMPEDLPTPK